MIKMMFWRTREQKVATRKKVDATPTPPVELKVAEAEARVRLTERMELGRSFLSRQIRNNDDYEVLDKDYRKWNDFNNALLKQLFTTEEIANEYNAWTIMPVIVVRSGGESFSEKVEKLSERIGTKQHRLDSIIERLELFPVASYAAPQVHQTSITSAPNLTKSNKVFVVHGRDEAAKANLEALLHEIGLEPVVLHRQADEGMTVIEKFEKHSDVGYAFILLTPDEFAYLAAESGKPDADRDKERRARPNVVFEWGYFVGKLGRSRVCCISTGNVDVPSDMNGLVTKRYQASIDEVAYGITKDLKAAGYNLK
jgi:predicted nucleotide-binding protein